MYQLEYLDKLGRFYHKPRPGFSFGTTLHNALQFFHEAGGPQTVSIDSITTYVAEHWVSGGYENADAELAAKENAARIVAEYHAASAAKPQTTEVFLSEKQLSWDMGDWILIGRVDRVDEHLHDQTLEIVDYKSGRTVVTPEDVTNALAMSVYQFLLKRSYPNRLVTATIYALQTNVSATVAMSDSDLLELESFLQLTVREIMSTDFHDVEPEYKPVCLTCDYKPRCSKHWIARSQADADIIL